MHSNLCPRCIPAVGLNGGAQVCASYCANKSSHNTHYATQWGQEVCFVFYANVVWRKTCQAYFRYLLIQNRLEQFNLTESRRCSKLWYNMELCCSVSVVVWFGLIWFGGAIRPDRLALSPIVRENERVYNRENGSNAQNQTSTFAGGDLEGIGKHETFRCRRT